MTALLDSLTELGQSDSFYDDLPDEALDQMLVELALVYSNPEADPELVQLTALAAAELELNTSNGGEVTDSVVTVAFSLLDGGDETDPDVGTIVSDVIESAFGGLDSEQFTDTLSSLQNAANAYEAFGDAITVETDENGDTVVDSPADVNVEAVAQDAVVAIAISEIVTAFEADNPGDTIDTQEELLAFTSAASDPDDEDYLASKATFDAAMDNLAANESFDNILLASGLSDLFSFGEEGV